MTSTRTPFDRSSTQARRPRSREGYIRFPAGVVMAELSVALLLGALVDLGDGGEVALEFAVAGGVLGAFAVVELRRVPPPEARSASAAMTMATLAWALFALGGAAIHLLADATDDIDTAIMEGTAAATTSAMTGLDADSLPDGLILVRSMMQWFAGFGGLVLAMVVIPLAMGGRELRTHGQPVRGSRPIVAGRTRGITNLAALYCGFSGVLVAAYAIAGLGMFDAVVQGLGTASTGGLSSRTGSLAAFDSAAVEWVATVGMAIAGVNVGIIWWLLQGRWRPAARSTELRMYVGVLIVSSTAVALWLGSDLGAGDSVRGGALAVASAMSTTGFTTWPWWGFDAGAQALMLVLVGVGSMAGSIGAGFRYQRLLEAARYARRELTRQLHPRAVGVVRMGGRPVSERSLERLTAFMIVFILSAAIGGMLVDLGDDSLSSRTAISLSLSALTTTGAQIADPVDLSTIGWLSKLTLSTLMLLGRLSIFGVILAVITINSRGRKALRRLTSSRERQ